jgi:hypothetical protein
MSKGIEADQWLHRIKRQLASSILLMVWVAMLVACEHATPTNSSNTGTVPRGVVPVTVQKTDEGFRLLRGGQPYYLRGGAGLQQFARLRAAGGNTVRLWSADYATPLLDEAQRQGLTVMMGLWLEPEGQYFSYYDPAMVRKQRERLRQQVLRYRHHPALLMWNVGNEVELSATGPRLFVAVNEIARMIHELDPFHPVTISISDYERRAAQLRQYAPEIDILSLNVYGKLLKLPAELPKAGWPGPYIITEYGGRGYWEIDSTYWHAAREQPSAVKAEFMSQRYRRSIQADSVHCLGSYVFFWGYKYEYTPTWFSLFEPTGEKTEMVDELQLLWRKRYPANRAPHVTALELARQSVSIVLRPRQQYPARVFATDPEGDSLTVRWEVLPELRPEASVKERTTPAEPIPGMVEQATGLTAVVRMPQKPGAYRLYARVFDGHGSVGTANLPILVENTATAAVGKN